MVVALVVGAAVGFAVRGALTWPALPTPTVLTSAENRPTAAPPTRLRYILQVHYEPGILIVRNDDPNHWTHVVATVGEGDIFFKCLVADTVAPLDHLPIVIGDCRSANGIRAHAAGTSTVVAEQGTIVSAIEPDVPAR